MCDFILIINNLIVTLAVPPTLIEILTFKARKWLVSPTSPLFDAHARAVGIRISDETYPAKIEEWDYRMVLIS